MSEVERTESARQVSDETPHHGKLDRKTLLILIGFAVGLFVLIALNMK